jgi:hypothetical protein
VRLQLKLPMAALSLAAMAADLSLPLPAGGQPGTTSPGTPTRTRRRPPAALPRTSETPAGGSIVARTSLEVAGYTDTDQVHVASPAVSGSIANELAGWSVGGQYLLDAVSAASVDVVSTASPRWFEYRHVGSGSLEYRAGAVGLSAGGGVSSEPDYLSIAASARVSLETPEKSLTPFVGLSYGQDDIGRTGMPKSSWQSMQKRGLQAGGTFVVGRSTIASLGGDAIFERGYLAKPYRYIPLFAPGTAAGVPAGASIEEVNRRRIDLRPADALPEARDRFAVTARLAHRIDGATFRIDERLYRDSWGMAASTTDIRVLIDLGRRVMFWPHVRLHLQQAVDFWRRAYEAAPGPDGVLGVPAYRTGDRELGGLSTLTTGGGLRFFLGTGLRAPWTLSVAADAIFTRYRETLYITRRRALFASTALEALFD